MSEGTTSSGTTPGFISLVMPVHNAAAFLPDTLPAALQTLDDQSELIVVDDGSTDATVQICRDHGTEPLLLGRQQGPAAVRNEGCSKARGDIFLFIDADVLVPANLVQRVRELFATHNDIAAVFGSYDDTPAARGTVAQYKNLVHHYVHQHASEKATTFWSGCGAVRKEAFEKVGGFDKNRFPPIKGCEDIDLGLRLRQHGFSIRLEKSLQVKHLKAWTFWSWIKTDIQCRAVPWTTLMYEYADLPDDLNVKRADRLSSILLLAGIVASGFSVIDPRLLPALPAALLLNLFLNLPLYAFFRRHMGWNGSKAAFLMHQLYYLYSAITFILTMVRLYLSRHPRAPKVTAS